MANIINSRYPNANIAGEKATFAEFVLGKFAEYGDKVALISPKLGKSYTFAEIINTSRRLAIGLHKKAGLRQKEVLSTCMANYIEVVPAMLGVSLLGAVVNTANPAYTVRELINQFSECKTQFVLTTADLVEKIKIVKSQCRFIQTIITLDTPVDDCLFFRDLLVNEDKDFVFPRVDAVKDIAFLLNSSGTTGLPKAVMLTHRTLVANLCQSDQNHLQGPAPALFAPSVHDVCLSCFPLFHIGGIIISCIWPLVHGAIYLIFERYDADLYLEAFKKFKVTIFCAPPPVLVHYSKSPDATEEDFESLRYLICGGAVVSKELIEAVSKKMKLEYIIQIFGMTELSPMCHVTPLDPVSWQKDGSCGVLLPSTQCKVIDVETGEALGPNSNGEICIRGHQVMEGYLNNPAATRKTIDADGWLHTGDIGYYDEDEYFYVVDRIKDLIKVKAFQVAPAELEAILFAHQSVGDAAVVGIPDQYAGELPRAYIVLKPGAKATEDEIKKFVAGQVVSYKRLEGGVVFVDEIPRTPTGKLLRKFLRDSARNDAKSKL